MSDTQRTHPQLWEQVKQEITDSDKGGEPGQWSARKAQLAVQEYKKRGGGYEGEKGGKTSLDEWTEEEWGTASGERSRDTGERYLPRKAREDLSDEEYERTSQKKRQDMQEGRQYSDQPADIRDKTAKLRDGGGRSGGDDESTKKELYEKAQEQGIEGRSKMAKDELEKAVDH